MNNITGIGLRDSHIISFIEQKPDIGWVEVHSENYLSPGSIDYKYLQQIRQNYNVSLHGIGMSLGSASSPCKKHLQKIKELSDEIRPFMISEHLSWSVADGKYLPDLLPIPYTNESLSVFVRNIEIAQEYLKTNILIENPSAYFEYKSSTYSESDFLNEISKRTGVGILLDVNNIYVSSVNNNYSAKEYIQNINPKNVKEIHLAGHVKKNINQDKFLLIDTHDNYICEEVWQLFEFTLNHTGLVHSLIEWDSNLPSLNVLLQEAKQITRYLDEVSQLCLV